jgi:hypothetical protein
MTSSGLSTTQNEVTGYAHPTYAASFAEWGRPLFLAQSKGWLLMRNVPGSSAYDAMGCYPLFVCDDWAALPDDFDSWGEDIVCVSLVTDPFGDYTEQFLRSCFPDRAIAFKEHFVTDLRQDPQTFVHPHHRRNARRASNEMTVETCENPISLLPTWNALYTNLVQRHNISGMTAFSEKCFATQLSVPGIVAFRAIRDNETLGMLLWYRQANRAYYHLGAYSDKGYELRASFALFEHAIDYFASTDVEWLNLGAGAGRIADAQSGLSRFKAGWSTGARTAYFCGRVFDGARYQNLMRASNDTTSNYFPAYRAGEFA